jgi:predicted RNA binding protein YcfA (HicA-like mRNA interferase family)
LNSKKLFLKIISSQKNIKFSDFIKLICCFGFKLDRVSGSHNIFSNPNISEIINIQNVKGEAKPYQIKQFLKIVEIHNLKFEE